MHIHRRPLLCGNLCNVPSEVKLRLLRTPQNESFRVMRSTVSVSCSVRQGAALLHPERVGMIIPEINSPFPMGVCLFCQGSERGHRDGCGTWVGEDQRAPGDGDLTRPSHGTSTVKPLVAASTTQLYCCVASRLDVRKRMRCWYIQYTPIPPSKIVSSRAREVCRSARIKKTSEVEIIWREGKGDRECSVKECNDCFLWKNRAMVDGPLIQANHKRVQPHLVGESQTPREKCTLKGYGRPLRYSIE